MTSVRRGTTRGRARGRRSARGFTLIEMIVIIIIIAVLASAAVPAYWQMHARIKFNRTVQEVVSALSYAREAAIQSSAESVVRFDPSTETFEVHVETPPPAADQPTALQEADNEEVQQAAAPRLTMLGEDVAVVNFQVRTSQKAMAAGGQSAQQQAEFRFHEDGTSDGAMFRIISLQGHSANIEVSPLTGRTAVLDDDMTEATGAGR